MTQAWQVVFYELPSGRCPVAEFITAQSKSDQALILAELDELQAFGPFPRGNKLRPLRGRLWELRFRGSRCPYRFLFFRASERKIVVVHAFCKQSRKTPQRDLELALRRMREYLSRN
ncbi:MAG TPA: type II toxin-antitoxin system RelE/ParE family toxin [Anaerolineae bacterium]|nr:type II toxin-antitoxin system RelE/ParE family toxin [Anaerolineae bacterium]HID83605.1 type II toxin-antitoxin system RelE/ParE family toxin [Anaerolineales bacterium]HIQ09501.1 type II toxin-antitoxin system RelE/ParE family toxin [Anaerolineaceae bacterium]